MYRESNEVFKTAALNRSATPPQGGIIPSQMKDDTF
jgi:hypothetical protein